MNFVSLRRGFERLMEYIVIALMLALAGVVTLGVIYRMAHNPLIWYDEVAPVLLAWLTYYGAALAALKRAHIGFPGIVRALPPRRRLLVVIAGEFCTFSFFIVFAWYGWKVLGVLAGDTLTTVDIPIQLTQSAIPMGAILFIIAEALALPEILRDGGTGTDIREIV
jgi:TRAP-type C4-dicarboxylate transport system permease small subunit